jgi:hypothetical protein
MFIMHNQTRQTFNAIIHFNLHRTNKRLHHDVKTFASAGKSIRRISSATSEAEGRLEVVNIQHLLSTSNLQKTYHHKYGEEKN